MEADSQPRHPDHPAAAKARDYAKIWNKEEDEARSRPSRGRRPRSSPHARAADGGLIVDWAMRYGKPRLASRIEALRAPVASASCSCRSIRNIARRRPPLSTTRRSLLAPMRRQPAVRIAPPYYDDAVYIEALATSHERSCRTSFEPDVILASFHGIPRAFSTRAIPITAIARRRCGSSASGSDRRENFM